MSTIPASAIVNVTPNVLEAGGSALDLNGLILSTSSLVPIGSVQSFASATAVSDFFGPTSQEADLAGKYFSGFTDSNVKPGALLFAQYNEDDVGAYLRGGDVSTLTLAELQALNAALSVDIDGSTEAATINLASATSFTSAAQLIQDGLAITGIDAAEFTGSISGTTLTVTAVASGIIGVGQLLTGTGVQASTYISALGSGTGGTGTYTVTVSQIAASQTIDSTEPAVSYSSQLGAFTIASSTVGAASTITFGSGALATSLKLTEATGAVLSQGADAADPETFMDNVIVQTQNWATFMLAFDPDVSGHVNKLAFAAWTNEQNNRYGFVCWDEDLTPSVSNPASASLGVAIRDADYSGTFLIGRDSSDYDTLDEVAAFVLGVGASIDFDELNGRTTYAFRAQSGLAASCTSEQTKNNLTANGYSFYGAVATANDQFLFLYNGQVSGPFAWMDSYVNQIWLNNALQLALMVFLTTAKSVPYNSAGNAQIEAALADPINAALNFGAIRAGVTLSNAQRAAINAAANAQVSGTIETRGWYLQILAASPEVRAARQSPPAKFWYTDGQSVQTIDLTSINIQ